MRINVRHADAAAMTQAFHDRRAAVADEAADAARLAAARANYERVHASYLAARKRAEVALAKLANHPTRMDQR